MIATDDKGILLLFEYRNEQALRESDRQYGALCRSVARNILRNSEDAEECVSDAMLSAWNAIPPAKPQNFCAYLLKLVRNHAINRYHAEHSEKRGGGELPAALDELSECVASGETVEQTLDQRVLLEAITRFLRKLPAEQRQIFVRRYWHTSSVAEIAADFDMTENSVSVMLHRTRKKLQKYLEKEGLL